MAKKAVGALSRAHVPHANSAVAGSRREDVRVAWVQLNAVNEQACELIVDAVLLKIKQGALTS